MLVGEPAGALAEELAASRPIPVSAVDPPLGLPSELLRRRPDIRSAERIVAAASARLDASTADLYPKFSLLGTAGLASVTAGDFFNPSSLQWSVGPSLTWPIFRRGMIKATIEVRDAQKQQALISYRRAILTGIEDVENAITAYRQERSRRTMLSGVVESRQRAAHLARETYAGGLTDFRTFLNAKRDLLQAQSELAQSTGELSLSLVALYKALGGGWSGLPPWEEVTGADGRGKLK